MFGAVYSESRTYELDPGHLTEVRCRARAGFHRAVAGMARTGNDTIMGHVLSEPWRLSDPWAVMTRYRRRFRRRPLPISRTPAPRTPPRRPVPGTAAQQPDSVHAHGIYDLVVDTGAASTGEYSAELTALPARPPRIAPSTGSAPQPTADLRTHPLPRPGDPQEAQLRHRQPRERDDADCVFHHSARPGPGPPLCS